MAAVQTPPVSDERDGFEAIVRGPCRVRRFRDDVVPREDIEHMVALATCAASACNAQAWRSIAIQDRELIAAMQAAVIDRFEQLAFRPGLALQEQKRMVARAQALLFAKAPLCIAMLSRPSDSPMEEIMKLAEVSQEEHDRLCARPELQSVGAAVQLLSSSAHAMGYAACWTCAPLVAGERLEELLDVEPPERLVALVTIGVPAEVPAAQRRLPLEQVLSFR
jgi:nitroreductase